MKHVLCWICLTLLLTTGLVSAQAPTGVSDTYGYHLTTGTTVNAANGVLQNDTDPNDDNLTAALQDNVQNGVLTLDPTGAFTYVPNGDFTGDDTFSYFANDGTANSSLVNVRLSPTPLLNVIITATGTNVSANDVAVFGPLGFGLDPGAFDGLVDPDPQSDANDPFDSPANPPILFGSPAILAIDNPTVTTTDLRYDARFFDGLPSPTPASATFTLKYDFGSPASPITLSWDATLFQAGGAVFDAGYTIAEVRRDGNVLAAMDTGFIVLAGPDAGSLDFILARGNVAPVAFDDREIVIFRSEAANGIEIDVLANDRDADGDPLSIQSVDSPTTQGGATSHDGSIVTYTPPIQTIFEVTAGTKTAAHPQFNLGNADGYLIDGIEGRELFLKRGVQYTFNVNAPGHPFYFTNGDPVGGPAGTPYNNGEVSGAPSQAGTVTFTPNVGTPDQLYYVCQAHTNMGWKIHMVDSSGEATGLISDPDDENTFDTFTYTLQDDKSASDVGDVSIVVLSGLIRASRSHTATAPTTGANRGLEVTVTVNYANNVGIDGIEITEVMPRTDEAFDTYSIPAGAGIGGLEIFNDANNVINSVVVGADEVTFVWDGSVALPADSFSFTYRVVGAHCESDPDNDCDKKTKLFEAGTVDFTRNTQAQATVPIATTNFTPEAFPIAISQYTLVTGEPNAATPSTTFDVSLRTAPTNPVTISLTSSNSVEGDVSDPGNALTFSPADFDSPQTITITGGNDDVNDGDQDYTISVVASGDSPYDGATGIISLTNEDDDPAGFTVVNGDGNTSEAGDTAVITVVLDSEPLEDVTVTVTLPNDLEVALSSANSHTFDSDTWDSPFSFVFEGQNDDIDDGDQQINASFNVSSTDLKYSPLTITDETLTNIDDDQAGVNVTDSSDNTGEPSADIDVTDILTSESGSTRELWVRLNSQPTVSTAVSIGLGGTDPGEASLSTSTLTFGTGDWDTKQSVVITGLDDNLDDANASYAVDFTFNYSNVSDTVTVNGTNLDNEMAGLIITPQAGTTTNEAGGQVFLDVRLMGPPSDSVTVDITGVDASEGLLSNSQLIFTTGDWFTEQTITVTGVGGDGLADGDVAYGLDFALTSNDANFHGRFGSTVVITNLDSDSPADVKDVTFSPGSLDFGEVAVGESKTLFVILNSNDTTVSYTTTTDAAVFAPELSLSVAPGGTAATAITFTPVSAGTISATISYAEADGAGIVAIPVIGQGVENVDGVLLINPTNVVAKPENAVADEVQVSFDVELSLDSLVQLDFNLGYPSSVLSIDSVSSTIADALYWDDGAGSIHFEYMDVGDDNVPTGVVLTISATANTASIGAWPLALSAVSTTPKNVVLQAHGAQLAVSDDVAIGDLDVDGSGAYNFDDLILIYRNTILPFNSNNSLLNLLIPATISPAISAEEIEANIGRVRDAGLDVDASGAYNFDDLILIYRNTILPFNSNNGLLNLLIPATISPAITAEQIESNIGSILP